MGNGLISAFLESLVGEAVSGWFDKRKERCGKRKEKQEEAKKIRDNRPEVKIVDYKDYMNSSKRKVQEKCDINIFLTKIGSVSVVNDEVRVQYNKEYFNEKEWCCVIYKFKNVGKTDIRCIKLISTFPQSNVLFDVSRVETYLDYELLSCWTLYDKKIYIGDSFTMKVCYHKECKIEGIYSPTMIMALEDSDNHFWVQGLFAPENKIYESKQVTYKEYRELSSIEKIVECFRNPVFGELKNGIVKDGYYQGKSDTIMDEELY